MDPQGKSKIRRFLQSAHPSLIGSESVKATQVDDELQEDPVDDDIEYFHPDLAEVHRIISCSKTDPSHATASSAKELEKMLNSADDPDKDAQYLVKWRGLSYSECTWEYCSDLKSYSAEVSP